MSEHFWSKTARDGDCLIWIAGRDDSGYGAYTPKGGRRTRAHRHAYTLVKGEIPDGLVVRHTCDRRACVNPEHLILGTHADNMNDARIRGRLKGCVKVRDRELEDRVAELERELARYRSAPPPKPVKMKPVKTPNLGFVEAALRDILVSNDIDAIKIIVRRLLALLRRVG